MKLFKKIVLAFLPSIPLYFWGVTIVTSDPVHIFGFLSYYYFVITLFISPISYILGKIRKAKKYANVLISLRRQFGILTAIFAVLHMIKFYEHVGTIYDKFFASSQTLFEFVVISISGSQGNVFGMNTLSFWFGFVGIILMCILLLTSNNYSQKLFGSKNWKRLQSLVYPLFIIMVAHIYFIGGWKGAYLYPAVLLFLLRFYNWFDKNFTYNHNRKVSTGRYKRFLCPPCGFIYDEEFGDEDGGLAPGTKFEDIPDDWICPVCGAAKKDFIPLDGDHNSEIGEDQELGITLESKKYLTDDVVELIFSCEHDLDVRAGQFCNIIFKKGKDQVMRSYSVVQYIDNKLTFVIKPTKDGAGLKEINKLNLGDTIKALGPYGVFILRNTSAKKIFIATGTGLSPIYNMMLESWDREKQLHFGVRSKKDLFYLDKLKDIPNLKTFIYLSGEEVEGYVHGRININAINIGKEDEVYICGNPQLVENITTSLKESKHKNVLYEKFV